MSTQSIELVRMTPMPASVRPTYLMCSPRLYDVAYVINPWMAGNVHDSSRERASAQWWQLYQVLTEFADVELIDPQPGSPDMVFTANAGLERDGVIVLSRFFYSERQGISARYSHYARFMEDQVLPKLNHPAQFYGADGKLKPEYAANMDRLRDWRFFIGVTIKTAKCLDGRFARPAEPGPSCRPDYGHWPHQDRD